MVYSFFSTYELLTKIALLCKKDREILENAKLLGHRMLCLRPSLATYLPERILPHKNAYLWNLATHIELIVK